MDHNKNKADDIMRDSDDIDDQALLANTLAQEESLLHSLEQAVGDIGCYVNANKTECMRFKQEGAIFTQSDKPLKCVDQFSYLGMPGKDKEG